MSPAASAALSLVALVLAIGAIVLATIANRRWVARNRPVGAPPGEPREGAVPTGEPRAGSDPTGLPAQADLAALRAQLAALGVHVADLRTGLEGVAGDVATVRADLAAAAASPVTDPTALRHVALVRYDAFADVGGRLSYSLALLDDTRSGLVLTTLAGKSDVRTYARTISAGAADGTLTAEEQQAIEAATGPTGSRP